MRSTSEHIATRYGATLVRINPRDFDVPGERHVSIPLGAMEGISKINQLIGRMSLAIGADDVALSFSEDS